ARTVRDLQQDLARDGVALMLVHVEVDLQADLDRHRLTDVIGRRCIFTSLHEALSTIRQRPLHPV
ncbi:MAG TPA: hypothetical protein VLI07_16335, partial [Candidatus Binatus sp.]|nr:hypothetical protein [Candidatus Binatus sp.]